MKEFLETERGLGLENTWRAKILILMIYGKNFNCSLIYYKVVLNGKLFFIFGSISFFFKEILYYFKIDCPPFFYGIDNLFIFVHELKIWLVPFFPLSSSASPSFSSKNHWTSIKTLKASNFLQFCSVFI